MDLSASIAASRAAMEIWRSTSKLSSISGKADIPLKANIGVLLILSISVTAITPFQRAGYKTKTFICHAQSGYKAAETVRQQLCHKSLMKRFQILPFSEPAYPKTLG
jgi:hypothetical protein